MLVGGEDGGKGVEGTSLEEFFQHSIEFGSFMAPEGREDGRLLVETKLHLDPLSLSHANSADC